MGTAILVQQSEIAVFHTNFEAVELVFYVRCYCNRFFTEAREATQQDIIQGDAIVLGAGV